MKRFIFVAIAVSLSLATVGGVRHLGSKVPLAPNDPSDPKASAGLFVGVREFTKDSDLTSVKYAVDDAVDLAWEFSIRERPPLLSADRVALALSGEPQKAESRQRLQDLLGAGAKRYTADQSDIFMLLEKQAGAVGRNGILVVSFATHGVNVDGEQYLFVATSMLKYPETMIAEAKVCDIVSSHGAARSLILVDACRERLTRDRRNGEADPRSAAAFGNATTDIQGQVVISAAAANEYAYDDDVRKNGVFTAAVIDGLQCGAATDARGFVTVDTLDTYVESAVLRWIHANKDPDARKATRMDSDALMKLMPLVFCPREPLHKSGTANRKASVSLLRQR